MKNSDFPIAVQIMNIAMNMARVGNWVADSYEQKKDLIIRILEETEEFLSTLPSKKMSRDFQPTLRKFQNEFETLKKEPVSDKNKDQWAERALTWANILQHRAKLA